MRIAQKLNETYETFDDSFKYAALSLPFIQQKLDMEYYIPEEIEDFWKVLYEKTRFDREQEYRQFTIMKAVNELLKDEPDYGWLDMMSNSDLVSVIVLVLTLTELEKGIDLENIDVFSLLDISEIEDYAVFKTMDFIRSDLEERSKDEEKSKKELEIEGKLNKAIPYKTLSEE